MMGFKLTWYCEYCDTEIVCKKKDLPDMCEACNDTGDARSNIEKYGCKRCDHYIWKNDGCDLVKPYLIEDIECPLKRINDE